MLADNPTKERPPEETIDIHPSRDEQERSSLPVLFGELAGQVVNLARQEVKLVKTELRASAVDSLGLLAAVLAVHLGVMFLFAAAAAGLATVIPVWAALLIVAVILVLGGSLGARVARGRVRDKGNSAHPTDNIKQTADVIKDKLI